ncbi:MAG: helix-turn-helix domain-containing protein [Amphritea sp.]|nr:helix-turn-helix domain-containing protein [Amphritea sp.]
MTKGDRLKAARLKEGRTQEQIAMELHVALTTYKGWEADREPRTLDMTARLCQCLGISLDYYVTGEECTPALTTEESALIKTSNELPPSIRKDFVTIMQAINEHLKHPPDPQN